MSLGIGSSKGGPMSKTEVLTVRLLPTVKQALALAAAQEHRSMANMIEVMVLDYCSRSGIAPVQDDDHSSITDKNN